MDPYPNPPITEAVVDIQVELPPEFKLADLELLKPDGYPTRRNCMVFQGSFSGGGQVSASASEHQIGYVFTDDSGKQLFQARVNGFTFSRLAPYRRWDDVRDEARKQWQSYKELVKPVRITRMAVRYINRIDIPLPITDFGKWLKTLPVVAEDACKDLSGFFMQVETPQRDLESVAVIREAIVPSPRPDEVVSVLLDIDLYRVNLLPQGEDKLWEEFEKFRKRKNKIFRACITPDTETLFN